jgi:hypothetical protein
VVTINPPDPPTSLVATPLSDNSVSLSWSTGTAGAYTQLFQDGLHVGTAGIGATSATVFGLSRATDYTFSVRHLFFGLTSDDSNSDVARPTVLASGGVETEPGDGYRYHTFDTSGNLTVSQFGRVDVLIVAGGGGGARHATVGIR